MRCFPRRPPTSSVRERGLQLELVDQSFFDQQIAETLGPGVEVTWPARCFPRRWWDPSGP